MNAQSATIIAIATASFAASLQAGTVALDFHSLPSAQGWEYRANASESSVFSVGENVLSQNSLATADDPAYYAIAGVIDPTRPFRVSFRARVLEEDFPADTLAFALQVSAVSQVLGVGLAQDGIAVFGPGASTLFVDSSIDTSQFHDYVLVGHPQAAQWQFWIDGKLVGRGVGGQAAAENSIFFGDLTEDANSRGEWAAFSLTQHPNH